MKIKFIILATIVLVIVFFAAIAVIRKDDLPPVACFVGGGFWKKLPDSCGDDCLLNKEQACMAVISFGCDCGVGKCWDGQKCISGQ